MICSTVLDALGGTPVVRLRRVVPAGSAEVVVKFEGLGVGGSVKTRTAWNMVEQATRRGQIGPDTIIVEPTSGNQGIGLALVAAVRGLRCRIVMPDSVSVERRQIIQAYGAEVVLVHDGGDIGQCIDECLQTALAMAAADPNVFVPQQFANPDNPAVHEATTARELVDQVGRPIDGFCAGIGTGGTITGIGRVLRRECPGVVIWAVEPEQAAILSGGPIGSHVQMGIGDGLIPANLDQSVYSDVAVVTDEEAVTMARRLAREEGLLCGISSGSNVVAALRLAQHLGAGKLVATLLPDTGERYFSTPLFA
ncbi:MAG: cysteine synthase family protein [Propionibacteriaceae bacterium]|jgi:cysteine synthase A|nr:cysteine synthase family protein [Propionibacteriaceae bacterium]